MRLDTGRPGGGNCLLFRTPGYRKVVLEGAKPPRRVSHLVGVSARKGTPSMTSLTYALGSRTSRSSSQTFQHMEIDSDNMPINIALEWPSCEGTLGIRPEFVL